MNISKSKILQKYFTHKDVSLGFVLLIILMTCAIIFRIYLGFRLGNVFASTSAADDNLLMQYAHLKSHFLYQNY